MKYQKWFGNTLQSNIYILTDNNQIGIANEILLGLDYRTSKVINLDVENIEKEDLKNLKSTDYLIVALSFNSFVFKGYNKILPTFRKPESVNCRYVFIRLDISLESFVEGLNTDVVQMIEKTNGYTAIENGTSIRVTSNEGTNITFAINQFKSFSHFVNDESTVAFLPPSEICSGIHLGTANGQIVVDLTIGQLYRNGNLLEEFGLLEKNVTLLIKDSRIVNIVGSNRLRDLLNGFEFEAMNIVELGIGLSEMSPTGNIGIDESISNTCHFGIGDGTFYGIDNKSSIHLDVVIRNPSIDLV